MKESAIYQGLEDIAQMLDVKVCTVNMRKYSYSIKSGLCRVKGEYRVILDKHLHLSEKIDVLVDALQTFDFDISSLEPPIKKLMERNCVADKQRFLFQTDVPA